LPLSGVHPIMMEKLAHPGEGGGCTPTLFHYTTFTYKVVVYAPAERQFLFSAPINNATNLYIRTYYLQ
jgi:hypothetical protein